MLKSIGPEYPGSVAIIPGTEEVAGGKLRRIYFTDHRYFHTRMKCYREERFADCPALKSDQITCTAQNYLDNKTLDIGVTCGPAILARFNNGNGHNHSG